MKAQLETGHQVPAYSYARNNPVGNVDPTGNGPCFTTYDCCVQRAIEKGEDPATKCGSSESDKIQILKCSADHSKCLQGCGSLNPDCYDPVNNPVKTATRVVCELGCGFKLSQCLLGRGNLPN